MLGNWISGAQAYALCVSRLHGWLIGFLYALCCGYWRKKYHQKELYCLMDEFAYIGRKHQYIAPCTDTTSILYWHYKHLVLALQAPCTGTTKYLVLALQAYCSVCAKRFSLHCKRCCADTLMAKWGVRTTFYNQFFLAINSPTRCCAFFLGVFVVRHLPSQVHVSCRIAAS